MLIIISDGVVDLGNPQLDYYALNAAPILNPTSSPYFEVTLDSVHGSSIDMLVYHKISDNDIDAEIVTSADFTQRMTYLYDNGFTVKTLSSVLFGAVAAIAGVIFLKKRLH